MINFSSLALNCHKFTKIAGDEAAKNFQKTALQITSKRDKSFVTQLDVQIENKLRELIEYSYPDHSIHGEEKGDTNKNSKYTWYLDPIDGTSNFIFGMPLFGSQIAVSFKDNLVAAAVYLPMLSIFVCTEKGKGVILNSKEFAIDTNVTLDSTTIVVDCGKTIKSKQSLYKFLLKNVEKFRSVRQPGCVTSHLALLQSQQLNIDIIMDAKPHDLYPLALIYEELGYKLLNRFGKQWSLSSTDLIAAKSGISNELSTVLKAMEW